MLGVFLSSFEILTGYRQEPDCCRNSPLAELTQFFSKAGTTVRLKHPGAVAIIVFALASFALMTAKSAYADCYVSGYYTSRGTRVNPYYRTCPDSNPWNNYSTKGNYNPYTGRRGYTDPFKSSYRTGSSWDSNRWGSLSGYGRSNSYNHDSDFAPMNFPSGSYFGSGYNSPYGYDPWYSTGFGSKRYRDTWSSYSDPFSLDGQ
jgi:hypothetical protein